MAIWLLPQWLYAQATDSTQQATTMHKRLRTAVITGGIAYGVALVGLNELWYKDYPRQSFRFFNDNAEWKQMDKLGHMYSSFYLSYGANLGYQWCGLPDGKSQMLGALTGFLVMFPIEVLDGFSAAYGASTGDLLANASGALLYYGQMQAWHDIRITPRFSFHRSHLAKERPNVLGDNLVSEILKDYNAQSYWFSVNLAKFFPAPHWLNVAVGYGAQHMVYARDEQNTAAGYHAYRQYYIAPDINWMAIHTPSKALRSVLFILNMIKIPTPTLEFSSKGTRFHWLY